LKLGKVNTPLEKRTMPNDISTKKVLLLIPPRPSKKQIKKSKIYQQMFAAKKGKKIPPSPLSYAQTTSSASSILKIKEAFSILLDRKILEIHDAAFFRQNKNRERKIQSTMKRLSRKQAIVLTSSKLTDVIIEDTNTYIFQINTLLKNIKPTLHAEFICPCSRSISIITNNVPNPSDLTIMGKHLKLMKSANILLLNFHNPSLI